MLLRINLSQFLCLQKKIVNSEYINILPAYKYCISCGDVYYLPSIDELECVYLNKDILNEKLEELKAPLILDEPYNNLDSKSKEELYNTIKELNEKQGITIIMITHDLDHHNLIGNKILSLREDEIFYGSTDEFVRRIHHD